MDSFCFFSLGSRDFCSLLFCPSRPDPCEYCCRVSLSHSIFSLVVWLFCCSPSSRFSSSFSLQALGKHKPCRSLWLPLCCPGRAPLPRHVHPHPHLHQGTPPSPAFVLVSLSASRSLSLSGLGRPCCSGPVRANLRLRENIGVAYQTGAPRSCDDRFGFGGGNRNVAQMRSLSRGQVLSHNCWLSLPFFDGEMLSVFFPFVFFLWSGSRPLPFFGRVLFLGSVCAINFRVRTFVFCFLPVALCFWWGFAYVFFCVFSCKFAPEAPLKILFMSGLVFWVRSSGLRFWVDDVFVVSLPSLVSFSSKRERSGLTGHHTPPCTFCLAFSFFFLCPRHTCLVACSGRASLLFLRFFGVPFWAPRFLDSLGTSLRPFFWTRGGKGVCSILFVVFCFPVLWCLRPHTFLVGLAPGHRKAGPRVVSPAPLARVRVRG